MIIHIATVNQNSWQL